jgi:hypothetical protein
VSGYTLSPARARQVISLALEVLGPRVTERAFAPYLTGMALAVPTWSLASMASTRNILREHRVISGCYLFAQKGVLQYIGQSSDLPSRLTNHGNGTDERYLSTRADGERSLIVLGSELPKALELDLIFDLMPRYNSEVVDVPRLPDGRAIGHPIRPPLHGLKATSFCNLVRV